MWLFSKSFFGKSAHEARSVHAEIGVSLVNGWGGLTQLTDRGVDQLFQTIAGKISEQGGCHADQEGFKA